MTSRSGESPSRLPSRDLPWTLMRSTVPFTGPLGAGVFESSKPLKLTASAAEIVRREASLIVDLQGFILHPTVTESALWGGFATRCVNRLATLKEKAHT